MIKHVPRLLAVLLLTTLGWAQSDQIIPNENLAVEGVPPIPSSLTASVERYSNYRGASLASWNPERREMLISTRFADVPEIHLVKMPGGDRSQLTFYPDPVTAAQFNPKKGGFFIFSKDVGGGEFYQFYRYDIGSGDVTLLTDGKALRETAAFSEWFEEIICIYPSWWVGGVARRIAFLDPFMIQ